MTPTDTIAAEQARYWRAYQAAAIRFDERPTGENLVARFEAYLAWQSVYLREAA